jgi:hypothetical protein
MKIALLLALVGLFIHNLTTEVCPYCGWTKRSGKRCFICGKM